MATAGLVDTAVEDVEATAGADVTGAAALAGAAGVIAEVAIGEKSSRWVQNRRFMAYTNGVKPIVYDLYCGLGGWSEGFLAEGYECIGYDIEAHDYGSGGYPGELRLRDVRSIHGSELKDATVIVGSSPCQGFSYRAMPWSRAKALPPPYLGIELFNAQFRIQREASEAAGRYIPMVVENVLGAQKWVGRAQWHYGSFYLWGDVPALMPKPLKATKIPNQGLEQRHPQGTSPQWRAKKYGDATKHDGSGWTERGSLVSHNWLVANTGVKFSQSGDAWCDGKPRDKMLGHNGPAAYGSRSRSRKAASAMIAKIPFALSSHIAQCFKP